MLTHISVRDLAIVESLSVDLAAGLTVMTGETGAGKSILIDALSLALGARSNANLVRAGASRAEITAVFDLSADAQARHMLQELELDDSDDELNLRRTISGDGRSRAYINGRPVPAQVLRDVGATLVDIHGQHEHQSLLAADTQRELLDAFGSHERTVSAVRSAFDTWRELNTEYHTLASGQSDHEAHLSLLRYQLEELDGLAPSVNEYRELLGEYKRLTTAEQVRTKCYQAVTMLRDDDTANAASLIARTVLSLNALSESELASSIELLESAGIQVAEAAQNVEHLAEQRHADPRRVQQVEQRLELFQDVARKHHVGPESLEQLHQRLQAELQNVVSLSERAEHLTSSLVTAQRDYLEVAARLSKARAGAAKKMAKTIVASMQQLGMAGGRCEIQLHPIAVGSAEDKAASTGTTATKLQPRAAGLERCEIHVAVNPGSPMQPLARVASGGELSRISLAIQVQLAQGSGVPCLVFDEVDVGIGGSVAEVVGLQLRSVAAHRQVLCITHLPQVASQGQHHLRVVKQIKGKTTATKLEQLQPAERVDEVARMLGGRDITARTRAHAEEMLEQAKH